MPVLSRPRKGTSSALRAPSPTALEKGITCRFSTTDEKCRTLSLLQRSWRRCPTGRMRSLPASVTEQHKIIFLSPLTIFLSCSSWLAWIGNRQSNVTANTLHALLQRCLPCWGLSKGAALRSYRVLSVVPCCACSIRRESAMRRLIVVVARGLWASCRRDGLCR